MSDQRYQAGITQGIALSRTAGHWPAEIPDVGTMEGGAPFARCAICLPDAHPMNACSFVRYGGVPYCKRHALEAAAFSGGAA